MSQTNRMKKQQFRIGQLANALSVEKYVIRFWEKEFNISSDRSIGGQRFYTEDDLNQFKLIKELLYKKGFTIAGARKQLETPTKLKRELSTTQEQIRPASSDHDGEQILSAIDEKLDAIKSRLISLKEKISD